MTKIHAVSTEVYINTKIKGMSQCKFCRNNLKKLEEIQEKLKRNSREAQKEFKRRSEEIQEKIRKNSKEDVDKVKRKSKEN